MTLWGHPSMPARAFKTFYKPDPETLLYQVPKEPAADLEDNSVPVKYNKIQLQKTKIYPKKQGRNWQLQKQPKPKFGRNQKPNKIQAEILRSTVSEAGPEDNPGQNQN